MLHFHEASATIRDVEEAPEPELCAWCTAEEVDPEHYPYCSTQCGIDAEADNVD